MQRTHTHNTHPHAGDASGCVYLLSADRALSAREAHAADETTTTSFSSLLSPVWAERLFDGPVSSFGFSAAGDLAAACSAVANKLVFWRVSASPGAASAYEIMLQLLGFYEVGSPQLLAWGPMEGTPGTEGVCFHGVCSVCGTGLWGGLRGGTGLCHGGLRVCCVCVGFLGRGVWRKRVRVCMTRLHAAAG